MKIHPTMLVLIFFLMLIPACFSTPSARKYGKDPVVRDFFRKTSEERAKAFANYDIETQYAIFIYGQQGIRPPLFYDDNFAKGGTNIVGLLKEKLLQAEDDITIYNILMVLEKMTKQDTCDVAADKDLMLLVNKSVLKIKDNYWGKKAKDKVSTIKLHSEAKHKGN